MGALQGGPTQKFWRGAPYAHNHGELRTFGPPNNFGVAPPLLVTFQLAKVTFKGFGNGAI